MRRRQRAQAALLLSLLVLAVMVVLTAVLSSSTKTSAILSDNYSGDLQNYYAFRAGVNYARLMLSQPKQQPQDTLNDTWAQPYDNSTAPLTVGNATVSFRIEDEERRLNAAKFSMQVTQKGKQVTVTNPRVAQRLDRLALLLGISIENFGQHFIDYQSGAQDAAYAVNNPSSPLLSFGEIALLKDMTPQVLYGTGGQTPQEQGLQPWITVWGSGSVNINTASPTVLQALDSAITPDEANKIETYLQTKKEDGTLQTFGSIDKKVLTGTVHLLDETATAMVADAKAGALGVSSTTFSVFLRARTSRSDSHTGGWFETRARVVLQRAGQNVSVLYWSEDQRYTKQQSQ